MNPADLLAIPGTFAVKCVRIPAHMPWYTRFAAHSWIDVVPERPDGWFRIEIVSPESGLLVDPLPPADARSATRWDRRVRILSSGTDRDVTDRLLAAASAYDDRVYRAWPGPNSNTFVAAMGRIVPELRVRLPWNAVGKRFRA